MTRRLGVDVASYQNTNTSVYPHDFAFVKISEGTNYVNPKAVSQIRSTIKPVHGYVFAHAGGDSAIAINEANYALSQKLLKTGSIIAYDYEASAGTDVNANTNAILAFMRTIKNAGFRPFFYSYVPYIKAHVTIASIIKEFPNSIWIASYPIAGAVSTPNFNYFPSMNGVAVWQFTDNYRGLGVDGNVEVIAGSLDVKAAAPAVKFAYKVGQFVTVKDGQTKNNVGYDISKWVGVKIEIVKTRAANGKAVYDGKVGDNPYNDLLESNIQLWEEAPAALFKVGDQVQISPNASKERNGYDLTPRRLKLGTIAKATKYPVKYSRSWYEYEVKYTDGTHNSHVLEQDLTF